MTSTPANRSTAAVPNASPPPDNASCCTTWSEAAPGPAAPLRAIGVRSTTWMAGSPTMAKPTSPTPRWPADRTIASSKTVVGQRENAKTAAPNGFHHHTSTPAKRASMTTTTPRDIWWIPMPKIRSAPGLFAGLRVVWHADRAEHILGRHIERQRSAWQPHEDILGDRVLVMQR